MLQKNDKSIKEKNTGALSKSKCHRKLKGEKKKKREKKCQIEKVVDRDRGNVVKKGRARCI